MFYGLLEIDIERLQTVNGRDMLSFVSFYSLDDDLHQAASVTKHTENKDVSNLGGHLFLMCCIRFGLGLCLLLSSVLLQLLLLFKTECSYL